MNYLLQLLNLSQKVKLNLMVGWLIYVIKFHIIQNGYVINMVNNLIFIKIKYK